MGDRNVGRHAGSSEWVAHEAMILCGRRVIVNNIVGLRLNALLGLRRVGRFRSANGALYNCPGQRPGFAVLR